MKRKSELALEREKTGRSRSAPGAELAPWSGHSGVGAAHL